MFETTANILSSLMMWTLTCYKHGISSHFNVMTAALEPQKLTMKLKQPDYSASSTLLTHAQTILLSWLWMENRYSADCCCGQNIFFLSFLFPSLPSPNIFPFSLPQYRLLVCAHSHTGHLWGTHSLSTLSCDRVLLHPCLAQTTLCIRDPGAFSCNNRFVNSNLNSDMRDSAWKKPCTQTLGENLKTKYITWPNWVTISTASHQCC